MLIEVLRELVDVDFVVAYRAFVTAVPPGVVLGADFDHTGPDPDVRTGPLGEGIRRGPLDSGQQRGGLVDEVG
ncbi:hypothetical protein GCM10029964_128890 [Kibdelosporangium lantanae]